MYAHQVIEDLNKRLNRQDDEPYRKMISQVLPIIKKSISFHLGDAEKIPIDSMRGYLPFDREQSLSPILYENLSNTALPYHICWIDWLETHPGGQTVIGTSILKPSVLRVGCLAISHKEDAENLLIFCFICHPQKGWQLYPVNTRMRVNYDFSNPDEGQEIEVSQFCSDINYPEQMRAVVKVSVSKILSRLSAFLLLMSCKNILTEVIKAPEVLNKKRRKNGKQEIFDYRVLNVAVPGKKQGYREPSEPLSHVRVHLCRGHFKEYTQEHPLFGRLTGRYWWQPHVRGQNREGIVMKNYAIKTKEAI